MSQFFSKKWFFVISFIFICFSGSGYNYRFSFIAPAAETVKVTFIELGSVNCIPCRMMEPVLERIEQKYHGQVKVIFHDVRTDRGMVEGRKYGIRVIPTQVFLDKSGKEYFRHEGFFPFEEVDKILRQKGVK